MSSNTHLHIPLAAAVFAALAIVVVIPIARGQAGRDSAPETAHYNAGDVSLEVVRTEAAGLAGVVANSPPDTGHLVPELSPPLGKGLFPESLLKAAAAVASEGTLGSPVSPAALMITRQEPVSFTLHEDGFSSTQVSRHITVAQALAAHGVTLEEGDLVTPPLGSVLNPGAHVYVHHAIDVRLLVSGVERPIKTRGQTVGEVLGEAGVGLQPMDRVKPGIGKQVSAGMTIKVTTVRDITAVVDDPIEPVSIVNYNPEIEKGKILLDQAGEPGYVRREYTVRQINGRETKRELISETVIPPVDEIVTIGTYIKPVVKPAATAAPVAVAAAVSAPENVQCARTLNVYATWYTAASSGGSGTTATGTPVYKGIVAVDPRVIPLGTRMYIPGYGYGLAADTGGAIIGNKIDLGYGADDVKDWRTRWVDICIL